MPPILLGQANISFARFLQQIMDEILKPEFKDYSLRNVQARIAANLIFEQITTQEIGSDAFNEQIKESIEPITEKIAE